MNRAPGRSRRRPPSANGIVLVVLALVGVSAVGSFVSQQVAPVPSAPAVEPGRVGAADVRLVHRALTETEAADYLGDAACARCHADAARDHAQTRHAHTLRPVDPAVDGPLFSAGNTVRDAEQGITYQARKKGDRLLVQAALGKKTYEAEAAYAMGTGRNAVTYFSQEGPDDFTKLRISHYREHGKWDLTPPKVISTAPLGQPQSGPLLDACLLCHVTVLRRDVKGVRLADSRLGVGCERCHGPGKPHVDAVERTGKDPAIERLGRASNWRINQVCGDCHHTSQNTDVMASHTEINLPRFQGLALEASACFRKGGVSCVTCHSPHRNAAPDVRYYDSICLSCHQGASGGARPFRIVVCPKNPTTDCTSCHMPKQPISEIPHARYRTHWIKAYR